MIKSLLFGSPRHGPAASDDVATARQVKPVPTKPGSSKNNGARPLKQQALGRSDLTVAIKSLPPPSASSAPDFQGPGRRGRGAKRDTSAGLEGSPTPSSPVQIPKYFGRNAKRQHPLCRRGRPTRHARLAEPLSPSLAALLAVTDIPRPKRPMPPCADDIVSDKEPGYGPLELLLSPRKDFVDDLVGTYQGMTARCALGRTVSADSIPSLGGDSLSSDTLSSLETLGSHDVLSSQRRRPSPVRRSLPSDAANEHPLAATAAAAAAAAANATTDLDADSAAFDADDERPADEVAPTPPPLAHEAASKPRRSIFKSNLTASLRVLRSAARSFSGINASSMPPHEDLFARSILTIDSRVLFADERRPPVTEEMPSAELRRYLNPTMSSLVDAMCPPSRRCYSASIQMQTYKVQRCRPPSPSSPPLPPPSWSSSDHAAAAAPGPHRAPPHRPGSGSSSSLGPATTPGTRQREVRENPDFIRIAVMEMAMRKRGKLDSQRPGRARWVLPPRRPVTKPYEMGANGVPVRWIPVQWTPMDDDKHTLALAPAAKTHVTT